jgi:acetyltransferase-like isoleucine patch superfamily enzyme
MGDVAFLHPAAFFDLSHSRHACLFAGVEVVWDAIPRVEGYIRELVDEKGKEGLGCLWMDSHYPAHTHNTVVVESPHTVVIGRNVTIAPSVYIQGQSLSSLFLLPPSSLSSHSLFLSLYSLSLSVCLQRGSAGPCVIGDNVEIRHGAFIRSNTILSDGVIVGHSTEVKGSVLLEVLSPTQYLTFLPPVPLSLMFLIFSFIKGAAAPHLSYIGDSIIGRKVNLAAGVKISNFPFPSPAGA